MPVPDTSYRNFGPTARNMHEDLTYWAPAARDKFGERSYATPVVMRGRWMVKNELITSLTGDEVVSSAHAVVPVDVAEGGMLVQGDYAAQPDPLLTAAYEIKTYTKIPDLRQSSWLRQAFM